VADPAPAELHRALGVAEIAAPHRERGRRAIGGHGLLGVWHGLELEQQPAEQPAGPLAGMGLDLDDGQVGDGVDEADPDRAPLQCGLAEPA
jgi:hypothetical protein